MRGPAWGLWQVAQPFGSAPWSAAGLSAWHCVHTAPFWVNVPACGVWQLAHAAWPFGAERASSLWQDAQDGARTGACAAPWQLAQSAWPLAARVVETAMAPAIGAWHVAHTAAPAAPPLARRNAWG
jgi:hypothetical protein